LGGGAERYLETLVGALDTGWVRRVVSLQDGSANDRFRDAGHEPVVLHTTGSLASMLRSSWRLRRVLHRDRPDVVHANGIKAALMCVLATRRIPVVWIKHDFSWDGRLARIVSRLCAQVVGVSEAVTNGLPRRDKVSVVNPGIAPPPVDRDAGRRLLRGLLDAPAHAPVITLVGRLHPQKGHPELLEVVPELLEKIPDLRIAFIGGDDPSRPDYAAAVRARSAELGPRVRLLGHRTDAHALVAGSDLLVVPSVRDDRGVGPESLSLVTLEAMHAGTAVVAYGHGGVPEVLGDTGRLVPPGDRGALADAIVEVLTDAELRAGLVERARARVVERFTLARSTEKLKDRYRAAVGRSPR
jgi:glycosyltransferase involved in cell wall biosynthesis